ncbi:N-acetylmuramic acid 6-phosphate etherase [Bacteroidales bacterium OttesenSCG-928-M11]|nr:N-acetylmuramic acid 6-phosphate etherase [Bacteroidales bacterium OttesenSCG-928-M11]
MDSITESPSRFDHLDKMSVHELLVGINQEDKTVAFSIEEAIPQIEKLVEAIYEKMKTGGRLFYLGAGTSGRLGVIDASELPPTYGVESDLAVALIAGGDNAFRKAVEGAEDDIELAWKGLLKHNIQPNDSVVGIAASGTTPYVIGGVASARKIGCVTGCITCNKNTPLSSTVEHAIEVSVGPEFVTGSTRMKSGTAQKMVLNMISTTLMIRLGKVKGNKMVNMQLTNQKLIRRGTRMIMEELNLPEEEAREKLLMLGSVEKVLSTYKSNNY